MKALAMGPSASAVTCVVAPTLTKGCSTIRLRPSPAVGAPKLPSLAHNTRGKCIREARAWRVLTASFTPDSTPAGGARTMGKRILQSRVAKCVLAHGLLVTEHSASLVPPCFDPMTSTLAGRSNPSAWHSVLWTNSWGICPDCPGVKANSNECSSY
ncbi:uncharacterized protein EDB93DRAFT_180325 [Suillus bovinus]|uniref:uncharacterized protein n=1 Tax=Suillus bovinus TaxID=48563 RepID=UPI001B86AF34|nr:uncharacterized protein EDB93DRAFT_180325 [Suillus bovinus]KAG2128029.1 hypothetical protein EDB93DRAFT_180325 [Suillus bovinus]